MIWRVCCRYCRGGAKSFKPFVFSRGMHPKPECKDKKACTERRVRLRKREKQCQKNNTHFRIVGEDVSA